MNASQKVKLALAVLTMTILSFDAGAVTVIRQKQQALRESLNQGLSTGELTREEAAQLFNMRVEINKLIQRRRDGEPLSNVEQNLIASKQKVLEQKTAALKANADKGPPLSPADIMHFNERHRIATGRKDGSLTADEYMRLNSELLRIQALKKDADTPAEEYAVVQAQQALSERIFRQRHDGQARGTK